MTSDAESDDATAPGGEAGDVFPASTVLTTHMGQDDVGETPEVSGVALGSNDDNSNDITTAENNNNQDDEMDADMDVLEEGIYRSFDISAADISDIVVAAGDDKDPGSERVMFFGHNNMDDDDDDGRVTMTVENINHDRTVDMEGGDDTLDPSSLDVGTGNEKETCLLYTSDAADE